MSDAPYLHLLEGVEFRPVFIIGDHRSGTTLLYQLLAATKAFNVVTAYHVIRYDDVLFNHVSGQTEVAKDRLATQFKELGLTNRLLDGVELSPDLPEEYGFIIDKRQKAQLRPETLPRFVELCRKLRFTGADRPLLLKNPWDIFQFVYVKQMFPAAKLIFVHRHPLGVIDSQIRAIESLFAARNPYVALLSPWYARLFERRIALHLIRMLGAPPFKIWTHLVPRHVRRATDYFLKNIGSLAPDDYVSVRYEDLCVDPRRAIEQILTFLDLSPATAHFSTDFVKPRASRPSPELVRIAGSIRSKLRSYCEYHGYDPQLIVPPQLCELPPPAR